MIVEIDSHSGFCFGVVYAIAMSEDELDKSGELYCLGEIVHNSKEVERLSAKGLKIIDYQQFKELHDCKVLIRAHGEPPETYRLAIENKIELIDASCPVVLKLQNRIRIGYENSLSNNGQIVIFGKEGHAEVNGLVGQTFGKAVIVNSFEDLERIDYHRPIYFFSQTTQSMDDFHLFVEEIKCRIQKNGEGVEFVSNDTICRQVANRAPALRAFSKNYDVVVFVSGHNSSNGKYLYDVCKSDNPRTYFVEDIEEIEDSWFNDCEKVGIAGATSTPMWLMEKVANKIKTI